MATDKVHFFRDERGDWIEMTDLLDTIEAIAQQAEEEGWDQSPDFLLRNFGNALAENFAKAIGQDGLDQL